MCPTTAEATPARRLAAPRGSTARPSGGPDKTRRARPSRRRTPSSLRPLAVPRVHASRYPAAGAGTGMDSASLFAGGSASSQTDSSRGGDQPRKRFGSEQARRRLGSKPARNRLRPARNRGRNRKSPGLRDAHGWRPSRRQRSEVDLRPSPHPHTATTAGCCKRVGGGLSYTRAPCCFSAGSRPGGRSERPQTRSRSRQHEFRA